MTVLGHTGHAVVSIALTVLVLLLFAAVLLRNRQRDEDRGEA